jgi:hypothetical protein
VEEDQPMRAFSPAVLVAFVTGMAALVQTICTPPACCGDEPVQAADKARVAPLDDRYEKVAAGVRKLKEADVVALLGPAQTMKRPVAREPGRPPADRELGWEFTTRITVRYKDGKVSEVSGVFSEQLPVERVTPNNFRRIRLGLTRKEVVAILSDRYATLTVGDGVGDQ